MKNKIAHRKDQSKWKTIILTLQRPFILPQLINFDQNASHLNALKYINY